VCVRGKVLFSLRPEVPRISVLCLHPFIFHSFPWLCIKKETLSGLCFFLAQHACFNVFEYSSLSQPFWVKFLRRMYGEKKLKVVKLAGDKAHSTASQNPFPKE
jgi:hypothetical protein